jgi:hypothetical protein
MRKIALRHHIAGIATAAILFNVFAMATAFFQDSSSREITTGKVEDRSVASDVRVLNTNLFEASRVAATKALNKGARIGFIYSSTGLCKTAEDSEVKLGNTVVKTIRGLTAPNYLEEGSAALFERSSLNDACAREQDNAAFIYTDSSEFHDRIMHKGLKPKFLAVSNIDR